MPGQVCAYMPKAKVFSPGASVIMINRLMMMMMMKLIPHSGWS